MPALSPRLRQFALISALAALAGSASAFQLATDAAVIYKGVDAHGKTIFSNNPKEMRNPVKVQLSAPSIVGANPYQSYPSANGNAANAATAVNASAPRAASSYAIPNSGSAGAAILAPSPAEASASLEAARKAQADGVEPLPGERQGTAGGGARLTPAYEERQRQLAAKTLEAQKALDQALTR